MKRLAILLAGCAPAVSVVQIPARPSPSVATLPSSSSSSTATATATATSEAPDPEPSATTKVFHFDGLEINGAPRCPSGMAFVNGSCIAVATKTGPANGCTLSLNSIPASHVFIDGGYIGQTPQTNVTRSAGAHVVTFLADDESARKDVSVTCASGERKNVVIKF
jgi:hypothetical protein